MEYINLIKNDIKFLGTSGSQDFNLNTSCLQVSENIVIDAGNIMNALKDNSHKIEHIFLTHSHLDHIKDIPFLIDTNFKEMQHPLKIYALKETIIALKKHIFNSIIWPQFHTIKLINSNETVINFIEIEFYKEYTFSDVTLKPIPISHTVPTCGFVIKKDSFSTIYAPDTYICNSIWDEANQNIDIDSIIIDVSFSSDMDELAKCSKHLTPKLLHCEIKKLNRNISIYAIHTKKRYKKKIEKELNNYNIFKNGGRIIDDNEYLKNFDKTKKKQELDLNISIALSKEKDLNKILHMILVEAMKYTDGEGGTIYLKDKNKLVFKSVINEKLGIDEKNILWDPVKLYDKNGENRSNVSTLCAITKEVINIEDVYCVDGFNFEGTKKFDEANNYRSKSMLVVPMIDHDNELIGVLQLLNKRKVSEDSIYTKKDVDTTKLYANWAAVAITKNKLIEDLENLLMSFLQTIAIAMSAKSPYGYGHIDRVADLMELISNKINEDQTIYKDVNYTKDELKELKIAALMHDIGKISTPEYILDKKNKLETIYDRIHEIKERFEHIKSKLKIQLLEDKITTQKYQETLKELNDDLDFLIEANKPTGYLNDNDIEKIKTISKKSYNIFLENDLLTKDEILNLTIRAGSLNNDERHRINEHARVSYEMLNSLPFPKKFEKVPYIASTHHEKLNGKGYPLRLKAKDISFEARMLTIADIFEALTANDRPYKTPKTVKEAFKILDLMVENNEIDGELVEFVKSSDIVQEYAKRHLFKEQIFDLKDILEKQNSVTLA